MSGTAYFTQECPTCGRSLHVRVTYLGRTVACKHCQGEFVASDPENLPVAADDKSGVVLLERVDELLATADAWRKRPR